MSYFTITICLRPVWERFHWESSRHYYSTSLADSDTYVVQRYKSLTFFLSFHTNAFESNYKKYICSWACYLGFPNRVKGVQKLLFSFPLHSPLLVQHDVQRNWKGGNIKTIFSKNLIYFFIYSFNRIILKLNFKK